MEFALFTLFYFFLSFCFIFPIPIFEQCGLTVEGLCSTWLKSEAESFTKYHMRRTVANVIFHSSLPLGYFFGRIYMQPSILYNSSLLWQISLVTSLTLSFASICLMMNWMRNNYSGHPLAKKLRAFSTVQDYQQVARDIDRECQCPLKTVLKCNPTETLTSTLNWIIKTSTYTVDIAHQSDTTFQVCSADEHTSALASPGGSQYLQIKIASARPKVNPFFIRINSFDYKQLKDSITNPIDVVSNIKILATTADRFLIAFREQVNKNTVIYVPSVENQTCLGCNVNKPNIKLLKSCNNDDQVNACADCYCSVLWCLDCMGTWFASRQDVKRTDLWMSSKCTCPVCRSVFCVLDVCLVIDQSADL